METLELPVPNWINNLSEQDDDLLPKARQTVARNIKIAFMDREGLGPTREPLRHADANNFNFAISHTTDSPTEDKVHRLELIGEMRRFTEPIVRGRWPFRKEITKLDPIQEPESLALFARCSRAERTEIANNLVRAYVFYMQNIVPNTVMRHLMEDRLQINRTIADIVDCAWLAHGNARSALDLKFDSDMQSAVFEALSRKLFGNDLQAVHSRIIWQNDNSTE